MHHTKNRFFGSRGVKTEFLFAALLLFMAELVSSPVLTHALISDGNPACADVLILFARGSGQNDNRRYEDSAHRYTALDTNVKEAQTVKLFDSIYPRIDSRLRVEYQSLHDFPGKYNQYGYRAVDSIDGFKNRATHRKDVPNLYSESVADGVEELAWFLEDRMTSCPFQQVVLAVTGRTF